MRFGGVSAERAQVCAIASMIHPRAAGTAMLAGTSSASARQTEHTGRAPCAATAFSQLEDQPIPRTATSTHKWRIAMKRIAGLLVTLLLAVVTAQLFADVSIEDRGSWPDTWPKEFEQLRASSRTIEGPLGGFRH